MQEVVGSNPTAGKICFSHFTLKRVECEELLKKPNIKLLKLITISLLFLSECAKNWPKRIQQVRMYSYILVDVQYL